MAKKLKVTQVRSSIGCKPNQNKILLGLGLRKMHQSVVVDNAPAFRGMIKKISHLVNWEEIDD